MDPSSAKTDLSGSLWGSLLYSGHERLCFFKTWGKMLKYDIMWWEERRETACGFWILGTVGILRCLQAKKGLGSACQVRWELPAGEQICQIEKVETKSSTPWGKICTVVKKPAWLRKTPVGSASTAQILSCQDRFLDRDSNTLGPVQLTGRPGCLGQLEWTRVTGVTRVIGLTKMSEMVEMTVVTGVTRVTWVTRFGWKCGQGNSAHLVGWTRVEISSWSWWMRKKSAVSAGFRKKNFSESSSFMKKSDWSCSIEKNKLGQSETITYWVTG